jgi:cytochrome c nitrite reductase small subunit
MNTIAIIAALLQTFVHPGAAPEPPHGATVGGTLGTIALAAIVLGVLGLVFVEFVWKNRIARATYRWLLLLGLLVLPAFALLGASGSMFEEMKNVEACNSCHVMNTFVDDMHDPLSASLAARHFRTGAIPAKQCYACHTGYGIFGTAEAKRDGFRHWLLYVTRTWEEPITFKGSYPNANCLACHATAPSFQAVESHRALREELVADEMGCYTCHALPHPSRPSREAGTAQQNAGPGGRGAP